MIMLYDAVHMLSDACKIVKQQKPAGLEMLIFAPFPHSLINQTELKIPFRILNFLTI